jgi:hypothetical protein
VARLQSESHALFRAWLPLVNFPLDLFKWALHRVPDSLIANELLKLKS